MGMIENVFMKYRFLITQLVVRDIKIKYKRSMLGVIWSMLNPLLTMLILNFVFSQLFRFQIDNYLVYFLTGSVLFGFFSEATGSSLSSIYGNASLLTKIYIPKYIFPFARITSSFVNLLFAFIALAIVVIATGVKITLALICLPLLLVYFFMFTAGISLLLATYTVFFRDVLHLHNVFISFLLYLTPIMYPIDILPTQYQYYLRFNPLYYYVDYFRQLVLQGQFPSLELNLVCFGLALVSVLVGVYVLKKNEDKFILYM